MSQLTDRQDALISELDQMDSWTDKFNYIIELGEQMPEMPKHMKTAGTLIYCQSRTYLSKLNSAGTIRIFGWSNALVPQGLCAMLYNIFDGLQDQKFSVDDIYFHTKSGLIDNLTEIRKQALLQMINRCVF